MSRDRTGRDGGPTPPRRRRRPRTAGTSATRRTGRRTMAAVATVTVGMFALQALLAVTLGFREQGAPSIPTELWVAAVLVGPAALAVYWRPAYRVPQCLWRTGAATFFLGLGGAAWGSVAAPVIAGATIVGLCLAPRDGGWQVQWARDDDGAQWPTGGAPGS